jgi:flagellar hook-length control protein FliK
MMGATKVSPLINDFTQLTTHMKTPLAALTILFDQTGGQSWLAHAPKEFGTSFAQMFKSQMELGINGALQVATPVEVPQQVASVSVTNTQVAGVIQDIEVVLFPVKVALLSSSVIHASETPELPVEQDVDVAPAAIKQEEIAAPASPNIDSGTPDVSEVQDETLSQIDDAQVGETGTTGNLQAEDDTMNTPAVQSNQATNAQNTVRQNPSDAFSADTSFDRVLHQQVANRKQDQKNIDQKNLDQKSLEQKNLEQQAATKAQERNSSNESDHADNTSADDKNTQAQADERVRKPVIALTPETTPEAAIDNAIAIAEVMRPTQLPANELPVKPVVSKVAEPAFKPAVVTAQNVARTETTATDKPASAPVLSSTTDTTSTDDTATTESALPAKTLEGAIKLSSFTAPTDTATPVATPQPVNGVQARELPTTTKTSAASTASYKEAAHVAATAAQTQRQSDTSTGMSGGNTTQTAQIETPRPASDAAPKDSFSSTLNALSPALATFSANSTAPQIMSGLHAQATAASSGRLHTPVGQSGWNQALGQHMVMMAGVAQQTATLTLNPPDLGPLQVVLQVQNSHAEATFTTAQPEVRQALENAMPKLREMMEQAGIELGQTTVNTGTPQQQQTAQQHYNHGRDNAPGNNVFADGSEDPVSVVPLPIISNGRGIVDIFA